MLLMSNMLLIWPALKFQVPSKMTHLFCGAKYHDAGETGDSHTRMSLDAVLVGLFVPPHIKLAQQKAGSNVQPCNAPRLVRFA